MGRESRSRARVEHGSRLGAIACVSMSASGQAPNGRPVAGHSSSFPSGQDLKAAPSLSPGHVHFPNLFLRPQRLPSPVSDARPRRPAASPRTQLMTETRKTTTAAAVAKEATATEKLETPPARIWWSNGAFFVAVHVAAVIGVWYSPPTRTMRQTLWLAVFLWQAASVG